MKYIGIVWNCSYGNFNKIKEVIKKYGEIKDSFDLELNDNNFNVFITELYNYPSEERWKSDYKIRDLQIYERKIIRIFYISINSSEMKLNAKGILTNIIAQKMKDEIRENFKFVEIDNEIKEIYAENSFHLTDNEEEYNYQKEIINKYVYKNKC